MYSERSVIPPTGLLIVTNLSKIATTLSAAENYVTNTLYIQLYTDSISTESDRLKSPSRYCKPMADIYLASIKMRTKLDVIVLIGNLRNKSLWLAAPHVTSKPVDILLFDRRFDEDESIQLMDRYQTRQIIELSNDSDTNDDLNDWRNYDTGDIEADTVAVGGTFDRLHVGHKILLTEAALRAKKILLVGVSDIDMLQTKKLRELILPVEKRISDVQHFLKAIDSTIVYDVIAIQDPLGPIKSIPGIDMLVVSVETFSGAEKINEVRRANNLPELQIYCSSKETYEGTRGNRISSSGQRMDLLGTRLKEPSPSSHLPNYPYVVGLTGNIASGKSTICRYFKSYGVAVIEMDKLAHEIYEPGSECYSKVVDCFGNDILYEDNRIDRKKLGDIVFADNEKLIELQEIVWPECTAEIHRRIDKIRAEKSHSVVLIESAELLRGDWERAIHEVWTVIIPEDEAIRRVIIRNGLTEEEAKQRIQTQTPNEIMIQESTVVFSTQWSYEFTHQQIEKAWKGLQEHLNKMENQF